MAEQLNTSEIAEENIPNNLCDKPVELWSTPDVIKWLQRNNLHKFSFLLNRLEITGKDLVDLKLEFLDDTSVSTEDRELFLSELYDLIKPHCDNMADIKKGQNLKSSWEQGKYLAAIQVSQKQRARSKSSSVLLCSDVCSSPKLRSRRSSLFETLTSLGTRNIQCVQITQSETGFGFTCCLSSKELISVIEASSSSVLKKGDVILEMNGILLTRGDNSVEIIVDRMMRNSQNLQLVFLRQITNAAGKQAEDENISQDHHCSADIKWKQLRDLLHKMKSEPVDTSRLLSEIPQQQISEMRTKYTQQADVEELKEEVKEKQTTINKLQNSLTLKNRELREVEMQRDSALGRLHSPANKNNKTCPDLYKPLWEHFESDKVSKGDILKSLKELMIEAGQQKSYFDHLLSTVIQRAPELLEEVDANFQDLSRSGALHEEEFC